MIFCLSMRPSLRRGRFPHPATRSIENGCATYLDFRNTYPLPDSKSEQVRAFIKPGCWEGWKGVAIIRGSSRLRKNSAYAKMPLESSLWHRCQNRLRMLKKVVQQGRSERRGEAYAPVRCASERRENAAGGLFQHPVRWRDREDARLGAG